MEFEREHRYLVFKIKDVKECCGPTTIGFLEEVGRLLDHAQLYQGKHPRTCVVVEQDWPEYEPTWDLIQRRVEGRPTRQAELQAEVERLRGVMESCVAGHDDCCNFICNKLKEALAEPEAAEAVRP